MSDDPINPAHYAGTECAQIGERLTGNSYQVLKYNWRLGKKDSAVIEVGKSIWYLLREIELAALGWQPPTLQFKSSPLGLPSDFWFAERLRGQDPHVTGVALSLINWNRYGDSQVLIHLHGDLQWKLQNLQGDN